VATLPEGLTQKDIDEYARLDAGLKKIQDARNVLNEKIKQTHIDAGYSGKKTLIYPSEKYGAVVVKLGEQRRLDVVALEDKHPYEKFPQFYRVQFDKDAVPADVQAKFRTNIIKTLSITTGE
jgi:hypothetical protein